MSRKRELLVLFMFGVLASYASATKLTFDFSPMLSNGTDIADKTAFPVVYGDHGAVSSGNGTSYSYDGVIADTPNIGLDYGNVRNDTGQVWDLYGRFWSTGYGGLTNVMYPSVSNMWAVIEFKPDTTYATVINRVDVASYLGTSHPTTVEVWESIGGALDGLLIDGGGWPFLIEGGDYTVAYSSSADVTGPTTFNVNVTSDKVLWLMVKSNSSSNSGVDNIDFEQTDEPQECPGFNSTADVSPDGSDGFVDFLDWAVFANAWQSSADPLTPNWNPRCDIAPECGDGVVDLNDLCVFVPQWLVPIPYWLDVTAAPYNADKTGIADCTAAFRACITDLKADAAKYGMWIPPGDYKLSDAIDVDGFSKLTVSGDADAPARVFMQGGTPWGFFWIQNSGDVVVEHLEFDGNNNAQVGLWIDNCTSVMIDHVEFRGFSDTGAGTSIISGIYIGLESNEIDIWNCTFEDITTTNSAKAVSGVHVGSTEAAPCQDVYIWNNSFYNIKAPTDSDGVRFNGTHADVYSKVESCDFTNCYGRAIKVQTDYLDINDCQITCTSDNITVNGGVLVDFQASDHCTLKNTTITMRKRNTAAIGFGGAGHLSSDITIADVDIYLTGPYGTGYNGKSPYPIIFGLSAANVDTVLFDNVNITDSSGGNWYNKVYIYFGNNPSSWATRNVTFDNCELPDGNSQVNEGSENIVFQNGCTWLNLYDYTNGEVDTSGN